MLMMRPKPLGAHAWQHCLTGSDRGQQIDRQHGLKVAQLVLCERLRYRCASVVDEDVAAPERDDGIAQRSGIGHIGNGMPGTERTGRLLQSDGIATDQRDCGAIGDKGGARWPARSPWPRR